MKGLGKDGLTVRWVAARASEIDFEAFVGAGDPYAIVALLARDGNGDGRLDVIWNANLHSSRSIPAMVTAVRVYEHDTVRG